MNNQEDQPLSALHNAEQRGSAKAIEQFERVLIESVNVMLRPHIAGVASIVKNQLLTRKTVSVQQEKSAIDFVAKNQGRTVALCHFIVSDSKYQIAVEQVECPAQIPPENVFCGFDEVLGVGYYAEEILEGEQILYCENTDVDPVIASMKSAWADRLLKLSDQLRQKANALETLCERLTN